MSMKRLIKRQDKMTRITSVKMQCNKSLNDLCKIQYKRGISRLKPDTIFLLNERMWYAES